MPKGHLVRQVWSWIERLNTRAVASKDSWLGRHAFQPKVLLALWVYGSLIKLHTGAAISRAVQTDAAFRWLTGGRDISPDTLLRFIRDHGAFLQDVQMRLVTAGVELGLVKSDDLSGDSLRLQANVSRESMRTKVRSESRLKELGHVDVNDLSDEGKARHKAKVAKHEAALAEMAKAGVTSLSATAAGVALMKFPDGASKPGHRVQAISSGKSHRMVVGVLVTAEPTDYSAAQALLAEGRRVLEKAGVLTSGQLLKVALDAGYWSPETLRDLKASEDQGLLDAVLASPRAGSHRETAPEDPVPGLLPRERFERVDEQTVICPAGTAMRGPYRTGKEVRRELRYVGVNCSACGLKAQCTTGSQSHLQDALRPRIPASHDPPEILTTHRGCSGFRSPRSLASGGSLCILQATLSARWGSVRRRTHWPRKWKRS